MSKKYKPEIGDRDIEVFLALYDCRALTSYQIERVVEFPNHRKVNDRLKILTDAKYTAKMRTETNHPYRYRLLLKGARELAGATSIDLADIERSMEKAKDIIKSDHFLGMNDFRISLALACARKGYKLTWVYGNRKRGCLPHHDAFFTVANLPRGQVGRAYYCFEYDTGTERRPHIQEKYLDYSNNYERKKRELGISKDFRVLMATPENKLKARIDEVSSIFSKRHLNKFFFASHEQITAENIFSFIWHSTENRLTSIV